MFERFKQKTIEIHHKYDVLPQFDYENCTEDEVREFFKGLTRIQMLEIGDKIDMDEIVSKVDFYKVYYEEMDRRSWPEDSDSEVRSAIDILHWDKDSISKQVPELKKQVEGIQKKLDKALVLISNAEFKLCGKDAMKL